MVLLTACSGGGGSSGDTTAPDIELVGANPLILEASLTDTYTDPGATASDNIDGDITSSMAVADGTVNMAVPSTYTVTYDVTDAAGNSATQVTRTVVVADTTPPIITLIGANPLSLEASLTDAYPDPGATASDNIDGDITSSIVMVGTVNMAVPGTYTVTYDVMDAAGNAATQVTRTIVVADTTRPTIALIGDDPVYILLGDTYTDPGTTAFDSLDGDISGDVDADDSAVDTATLGDYSVTYDVTDAAGNAALQVTRAVNVINAPLEIISFSISNDPAIKDASETFSWDVSNVNGDTLICLLDIENDGTDDYTINDCANSTSQTHTYTVAGDYTAKLTVSDGITTPVTQTLDFTVIAPLSTDVSVTGPAVAGERLLYTITVANTTQLEIDNVTVSLLVPAELSFHASVDAEPNTNCGSACIIGEEATWSLGPLAAGESRTISVNALVGVATLNGVTISLPVTFGATGISSVQINKTVDVFNTASADLALSASTDPVVANETFTYNLDFGNTSGGPLTTVVLQATLPAGISVDSISNGGTEISPGVVEWNEGSLDVGHSLHREIRVTANAGLTAGQILTTTAQLTHDGGLTVDNSAEHAITVVATALPLEVNISTSANPVVEDKHVLYTLTVSNSSLQQVSDVYVQLRVPAELSFHASVDAEPNTDCGSACIIGEEATWSLETLAAGESRTITVNTLVAASVLSGNLISTPVRVTATGLYDTINLLNTVAVFNSPSVDLALSASTDPVVANETFTYNLDFGNTSAESLTTVVLQATLPAGVSVDSISNGGTEISPGVVEWNVATLNTGASVHREISVIADNAAAGDTLMLSAELSHDGGLEIDNRSEFSVSVAKNTGIASLLSVVITTTPQLVASNETLSYTITVTNGYGLPASDVYVIFRVPAELSFHAVVDAEPDTDCGSACIIGEEATWSLGTLAAGASQIITIDATVAASLVDGTLIVVPVRVTATDMEDTINLQHTTVIDN